MQTIILGESGTAKNFYFSESLETMTDLKFDSETTVQLPVFHNGQVVTYALVDPEDAFRLGTRRLYVDRDYVHIVDGKPTSLSHFVSGNPEAGFVKEYINRYSLDNRKSNLRDAAHLGLSRSQNQFTNS